MASLPTPPTVQPYMICQHVGEKAVLLFTRAIKAETGLLLRSIGRGLLTGNGDISVQVPRVVDGHCWPNPRTAGMILRVSPRQTRWAPWPTGVGAVSGTTRWDRPRHSTSYTTGSRLELKGWLQTCLSVCFASRWLGPFAKAAA
jgi:hypothetical protein